MIIPVQFRFYLHYIHHTTGTITDTKSATAVAVIIDAVVAAAFPWLIVI